MPGFKKRSRPTTLRAPTTSAASPPASPPSSNDEGNVVTGASTSTTSTAKKARGAPLVHQFTSDTTAGRDNKTFATLETETSSSGDQRTRLEANLTSTLGATTNDDTGLYTGANNYKAIIPKSFDSIRGAKGNGNSGPLRANTTIRVTSRFDYQPDVCKDYKDTGFCGFGDTCIFMHVSKPRTRPHTTHTCQQMRQCSSESALFVSERASGFASETRAPHTRSCGRPRSTHTAPLFTRV